MFLNGVEQLNTFLTEITYLYVNIQVATVRERIQIHRTNYSVSTHKTESVCGKPHTLVIISDIIIDYPDKINSDRFNWCW